MNCLIFEIKIYSIFYGIIKLFEYKYFVIVVKYYENEILIMVI